MVNPRLTLAGRELASLKSEKTILVAILVQFLVASFSSVLVVGVVTMYSPQGTADAYTVEYGVVGPDRDVVETMVSEHEGAELATYIEFADAFDAYNKGHIDAVMYVSQTEEGRTHVRLLAPEEGFKKTAVVSTSKEIMQAVEEQQRTHVTSNIQTEPVPLPSGSEPAPYAKFTYTVLLPVLMFLPAFISGSLVSDTLIEGRTRGTVELLRTTPLSDVGIFDAKVLTMVLLTPAQAVMWIGLLHANGVTLHNVPLVLLVVTGIAFLIATLGAATAYYYETRAQSQFAYALLAMGVFAGMYILPEHPINTIAKLSLDNPGPLTTVMVGVFVVGGILSYTLVRRVVQRRGLLNTS